MSWATFWFICFLLAYACGAFMYLLWITERDHTFKHIPRYRTLLTGLAWIFLLCSAWLGSLLEWLAASPIPQEITTAQVGETPHE